MVKRNLKTFQYMEPLFRLAKLVLGSLGYYFFPVLYELVYQVL